MPVTFEDYCPKCWPVVSITHDLSEIVNCPYCKTPLIEGYFKIEKIEND